MLPVVAGSAAEAEQGIRERTDRFPLRPSKGTSATLDEIAAFVTGQVDDGRIAGLVRPLAAVEWDPKPPGEAFVMKRELRADIDVPISYALFRVCMSPWLLDDPPLIGRRAMSPVIEPKCHPAIVRHLRAGRMEDAARLALRLLAIGGARPKMHRFVGAPRFCHRILAGLAIPVSSGDTYRLSGMLFKPDIVGGQHTRTEITAEI